MGIVVGPDSFKSEFITDCLELIVGSKKPTTLIHDVATHCNVTEELEKIENEDYKRYLQKCRVVPFTFDFADPCLDKMIEVLEFKSAGAKKELVKQADVRGEQVRSDIRTLSSKVAKGRLNASVYRKYDLCMTCTEGDQGEHVLQLVYESLSKYAPAMSVAR